MQDLLGAGRRHVVAMCRLRHVLSALSHLYFPDASGLATWSGTDREGDWLVYDRSGDHCLIAWTPLRIVGLVFDHDSPRSEWRVPEPQRDPLKHLRGICQPWDTLAREAAASIEDLVTAGFWGDDERIVVSDAGRFDGFALHPHEAAQRWGARHGLTSSQAALALRLSKAHGTLTDDDDDILLELPEGVETLELEAVRTAGAQLGELGIRWKIPTKRIRALNAAHEARERARIEAAVPPGARALFAAVRRSDPARVRLLALPETVDARTVEGQWAHTPAGDTPLIQACKAGARDCALVLVAAGADVDLANSHGQSGLLWAARLGEPELLRACIEASRDPGLADSSGHTPLHHVAASGDAELVELLVARGADPHAKDRLRTSPADWAARSGHDALADRLRG